MTVFIVRGEPHIDFPTQCVITTLAKKGRGSGGGGGGGGGGGEIITNEILKFRNVIEVESSYIVICFS